MKNLLETWEINQKMNQFLIQGIKEEYLSDRPVSKGRSVGEQFTHIHNVRLMWIKVGGPELLDSQKKFENEEGISRNAIIDGLQKSSEAITKLLQNSFTAGKIKGFKPHPEAFLGYLIAHEAHHRGQITMILKENGHMPDKKILYGLWEWGTK